MFYVFLFLKLNYSISGTSSLQEVTRFLRQVVTQESGADVESNLLNIIVFFIQNLILSELKFFRQCIGCGDFARTSCPTWQSSSHVGMD